MNQASPSASPQAAHHPWEISPQDVARMRAEGRNFLFLDVRTPEEREAAAIEGTQSVPMQDLDLHMPELRQHQDDFIIVHCKGGKRSMTVTTVLRANGFTNVKSMAGGIERWIKEIDPGAK